MAERGTDEAPLISREFITICSHSVNGKVVSSMRIETTSREEAQQVAQSWFDTVGGYK